MASHPSLHQHRQLYIWAFVLLTAYSVFYASLLHFNSPTADAAGVECPGPSTSARNVWPTSTSTNYAISYPSKMGLSGPKAGIGSGVKKSLNLTLKYNLNSWLNACYGRQAGPITPTSGNEEAFRTLATVAYSTSVALKTNGYDPKVVKLSGKQASDLDRRLIVGLAMAHVANGGTKWGHSWQSSYWAFLDGTAGWLLQANLSGYDRQAVARMVASEADYQLSIPVYSRVRYYADNRGNVLTPGNTGAEEDAWNSSIMGLAAAMLPHDSRVTAWRQAEAQFQIAALSKPSDVSNNRTVINGRCVCAWLSGSNIFENGSLVNHNIINPSYMTSANYNLNGLLTAGINAKPGLATAMWNTGLTYSAFTNLNFNSPPYIKPGGKIYKPAGNVYYPQGVDWGRAIYGSYIDLDTFGTVLGFGAPYGAQGWLQKHLTQQLRLQARFKDGRSYSGRSTDSNPEYRYLGREQIISGQMAQSWFALYLNTNHLLTTTNSPL